MKKRKGHTQEDIDRWKAQGRGQGHGRDYLPWDTVRDVPSEGQVSRVWSDKTERVSHLLSGIETHHFLACDFSTLVADLREQFALLPESETQKIAARLGIRHPVYPNSTTKIVVTTDLVLSVRRPDGSLCTLARSVKKASSLKGKSVRGTLEKLEIERRYWTERGVRWQLVTDADLPEPLIAKLLWLNHLARIDDRALLDRVPAFLTVLASSWSPNRTLRQLLEQVAKRMRHVSFDQADQLFRHCVWRHLIDIDLTAPLGLDQPVRITKIAKGPDPQHKRG